VALTLFCICIADIHHFSEPDSVVTLHVSPDVCNWHVLEILLIQTHLKW